MEAESLQSLFAIITSELGQKNSASAGWSKSNIFLRKSERESEAKRVNERKRKRVKEPEWHDF